MPIYLRETFIDQCLLSPPRDRCAAFLTCSFPFRVDISHVVVFACPEGGWGEQLVTKWESRERWCCLFTETIFYYFLFFLLMRLENEEEGNIERVGHSLIVPIVCWLVYCRFLMLEGRYQYRRLGLFGALLCCFALRVGYNLQLDALTRQCTGYNGGGKSWAIVYTMVEEDDEWKDTLTNSLCAPEHRNVIV